MKIIHAVFYLTIIHSGFAQFADSFSDGNFTSNPEWSGSGSDFIVNAAGQLQLKNTVGATSFLSTPFSAPLGDHFEWKFFVRQNFAGSNMNFGRVYLISDIFDLTSPLNGYYLQFGETGSNDAVQLFRQTGITSVSVCRAPDGGIASAFSIRVKVTRDGNGLWQIFIDPAGGTNFSLATSGTDATHSSSSFFGIRCTYTIGNISNFFYDDFVVSPTGIFDVDPPTIQAIDVISANEIVVRFNEEIENTSALNTANFSIAGVGQPSSSELLPDLKSVKLILTTSLQNGLTYQISVGGIGDLSGNILSQTNTSFLYFQPTAEQFRDLILTEIFPDPSPMVGLPDAEFVEIFNRSPNPFNIQGWKLSDGSSTATLPNKIVLPGEYWVITATANVSKFDAGLNIIGVSNFPTLNNNADNLTLKSATNTLVDSVSYALSWYRDIDKQEGGWTLELINPTDDCRGDLNWAASKSSTGGTPGIVNSIFSDTPDTQSPAVISAEPTSETSLLLKFDERLTELSGTTISLVISPVAGVLSSEFTSPDLKEILITLDQQLQKQVRYEISVYNIADCSGNAITGEFNTAEFYYLENAEVLHKDVVITEIMADPEPVIGLPNAEYIELYNRTDKPLDLAGWRIYDETSSAEFPPVILHGKSYLVVAISSKTNLFDVPNIVGVPNFPTLNNTGEKMVLKTPQGATIDSLKYSTGWYRSPDKQEGGWSLEIINPDDKCAGDLNWSSSIDSNGGTPGKVNSIFSDIPDTVGPKLVSLDVVSDVEIHLKFDEKLNGTLADFDFSCEPSLDADASFSSTALNEITLSLTTPLQKQIRYDFSVVGVTDCAGNNLNSESANGLFYYLDNIPVRYKDIIITEIMADPEPTIGLPNAEFIELFNPAEQPLNLKGWKFSDATSYAILPSILLLPKQYVTLTATSKANEFSPNLHVVGVSNFPTLNNTGEALTLKSPVGVLIDSVNYSPAYYKDADKKEGGWSIELIDPFNPCGELNNWTASESKMGGTPSAQNSVFANKPDLTGPKLKSVVANGERELLLAFDEKLEVSAAAVMSITIHPEVEISSVQFTNLSLNEIKVELSSSLQFQQLYSVQINDVNDCAGNEIQAAYSSYEFALPEIASPGDLIVNELLFNPRPGGVDFVELWNVSTKYITLKDASFADINPENAKLITSEELIIRPNEYKAFSSDPSILANEYPLARTENFIKTSLPSLPDDAGFIQLINQHGEVIDLMEYNKDFHSALIRDPEGISLERIGPTFPSDNRNSWRSATAVSGYATPGFMNSNFTTSSPSSQNIKVDPEIISPGSGIQDFTMIRYQFDQTGLAANVKVIDHYGRVIKTVTSNEIISTQGFFRWDGDQDDGTRARMGYYFVWFEVFSLEGMVGTYKKRIIVAAR